MNSLASLIFPPLSALYGVAMRVRSTVYQRGWFSVSHLAVPIISVGNLTAGGTGKTPLVEWVSRVVARQTGRKVCVLTRGYGRTNPQSQVMVSDGNRLLANAQESGDEPYLLAQNLSGIAAVIANPNRFAAGDWAIANLGCEVFVLDDGFQHLGLARDLDIVAVDATNPWGGGSLLPYGRLRERPTALSRADCVVITRTEQVDDTTPTRKAIQGLVGAKPVFSSRMVTRGFRKLDGQNVKQESLGGQPVAAFCGVGNPESFFHHLRGEGFTLALTRGFADHYNYCQADIDRLVNDAKANGASALMTTAKDGLKLVSLAFELPCYVLDIQLSVEDDDRLVQMIQATCENGGRTV